MVKEHRLVFDIEDLSCLAYGCPHCKQEITYRLDGKCRPSTTCHGCGESLTREFDMKSEDARFKLISTLRRLIDEEDPKVQVKFVVNEVEDE